MVPRVTIIDRFHCIHRVCTNLLTGTSYDDIVITRIYVFVCRVVIVNTNDAPAISLDGEAPVISTLPLNYTEGSGAVMVTPSLVVLDSDPDPMIQR